MCLKSGDWSRTLILFRVPGNSKKACQIQVLYKATASKMTVGSFSFSMYCPLYAVGQFFQVQCIQLSKPSIPGNPCFLPTSRSLAISALFGVQRYSSEKNSTTAVQNCFRVSRTVFYPTELINQRIKIDVVIQITTK